MPAHRSTSRNPHNCPIPTFTESHRTPEVCHLAGVYVGSRSRPAFFSFLFWLDNTNSGTKRETKPHKSRTNQHTRRRRRREDSSTHHTHSRFLSVLRVGNDHNDQQRLQSNHKNKNQNKNGNGHNNGFTNTIAFVRHARIFLEQDVGTIDIIGRRGSQHVPFAERCRNDDPRVGESVPSKPVISDATVTTP